MVSRIFVHHFRGSLSLPGPPQGWLQAFQERVDAHLAQQQRAHARLALARARRRWCPGVAAFLLMSDEKLSKKEQAFLDAKALGNDAVAAGRWADAAEAYTAALRAGPSTYWVVDGPAAAVLSNRSLAHLKCGLFDKALADAAECIALRPDWSKAHFRRGDVYRHLGQWRQAEACFSIACR